MTIYEFLQWLLNGHPAITFVKATFYLILIGVIVGAWLSILATAFKKEGTHAAK